MNQIKVDNWDIAGKYIEDLKIDLNYFDFGPPGKPKYSWMAKTFTRIGVVRAISEIDNNPLIAIEKLLVKVNLNQTITKS